MTIADPNTGIIHRPETFDTWILNESKSYFPMGLSNSDVVLDLGGHIGTFASRARLEAPEAAIFSVEAQKDNYGVLSLNAEKFQFAAVHRAVVHSSQHNSDVTMYVNEKKNNALHSSVPVRGRATESVKGVGLSQVFDHVTQTLGQVTVLKVDIEGAEFELDLIEVLRIQPTVRKVVMEIHLQGKTASGQPRRDLAVNYVRDFESAGFRCTKTPVIEGKKNWTTMATFERS